jgi:hypothetical protein
VAFVDPLVDEDRERLVAAAADGRCPVGVLNPGGHVDDARRSGGMGTSVLLRRCRQKTIPPQSRSGHDRLDIPANKSVSIA